jgi:uncharacterized protein (TIGR03435 family)
MRRLLPAALLLASALALTAQTERPTFEVASIKRNKSGSEGGGFNANAGFLRITNNPLRNVIRNAWQVQAFQIVGGPGWIDTERWDIVAKVDGNPGPQMMAMVQSLLADRFKLVAHKETREMPIYALVFARADRAFGPKLHASSTDCQKEMSAAIARSGPPGPNSPLLCGIRSVGGHIELNAAAISSFIRNLAPIAGRSIVDRTGLAGGYDADLTWNDSEQGPSLFTAIQEQLGLKLDAQRGPVDVLVIDSVERPTED